MADIEQGDPTPVNPAPAGPTLASGLHSRRLDVAKNDYPPDNKLSQGLASASSLHSAEKQDGFVPEHVAGAEAADSEEHGESIYRKYRPFILGTLALLILGWWISATILPTTRHRW